MRYVLIKFKVYLLVGNICSGYTDHLSLHAAVKTPHLYQRMARWLSYFSEYNFVVFYKPGKNKILDDTFCRRPNYDPRRDMGHQPGSADDKDDEMCMCCINLGANLLAPKFVTDVSGNPLVDNNNLSHSLNVNIIFRPPLSAFCFCLSNPLGGITYKTRDALS